MKTWIINIIAVIYRYKIRTSLLIFFIPQKKKRLIFSMSTLLSRFSLFPSNRRVLLPFRFVHRFGEGGKVVRFVVERVGRIIELNEEATFSFPVLFSKRGDETLRHNFTFRPRRGIKVNWRNWCHAAVAILTLYGREGEKYWRSERSSGPCPVENKHHRRPQYLVI